jgi:membrane protein implicated in regulation of membrane protease activity
MFHIKRNLPVWERLSRVVAGAACAWIGLGPLAASTLDWLVLATGVTLLLTAFVGFCPACAMIGRRYLDR